MAILLTAVRGVGPAAAKNLTEHGITTVEELASISVTSLCQVPGYGTITAQRIIASAKALLAQDWQADIEGRKVKPKVKVKTKTKGKKSKTKSGKKKRKTNKQESVMAKKNSKKVKSLKKEIKSRKSKVAKQDKKIKSLKKAVKKAS
jgi:hypothetical protein